MNKPKYQSGTVGALIEELTKDFKLEDPIVYGYWSKEFIQERMCDDTYSLTDEDVIYLSNEDYDWSNINEQIEDYVNSLIEEATKDKQAQAEQEQLDEQLEQLDEQLWKE